MGTVILAFGLLRTLLDAWYTTVDATSSSRLVTRNAVSLIFPLPLPYYDQIRHIQGVKEVSYSNWFGGIYINEKNFFVNFAVEPRTYLALYPEYVLPGGQKDDFLRDRRACIVGRKLAQRFGWSLGDTVTLKGTIYPGDWVFAVRGIYEGRDRNVDETQFFFHWDYLNETIKKTSPVWANKAEYFMVGVSDPRSAADVADRIDAMFRNSRAETRTEPEKAFMLGFISMAQAFIQVLQIVSFVVIVIILAVVANTMAMTTQERTGEYAVLKTLGYSGRHLAMLIMGEALVITLTGCALGIALTYPVAHSFSVALSAYFPTFNVGVDIVLLDIASSVLVAFAAAVIPLRQAQVIRIADGLRRIG
jgi:putative ABC transport system permease protein